VRAELLGRWAAVIATIVAITARGASMQVQVALCQAPLMTTPEARHPKNCSTCGKGPYRLSARAGRTENYKGFDIELPADYPLMECDACGDILMSPADMKFLAPLIEAQHHALTSV